MEPLKVAAHLDALSDVGAFVAQAAERAAIDRKAAYRLRLAVDEIVTNIIVHGRPGERGGNDTITIRADVDEQNLTVTLEDFGPAFNPLEHELPEDHLVKPIDDRSIGGLGVFLAIRGVDQFRYERDGSINRHIFIVHRKPTPAQAR